MDLNHNKKLISEKDWLDFVSLIEKGARYNKLEKDKKTAKEKLKISLINSIKKRVKGNIGVLFSGGIDSSLISLILKMLNKDFICFTVGLKNSPDLIYAKRVAKEYNFKIKTKTLTLEELEVILKKTLKILKKADVMKAGVGSVLLAGAELAKKNKINDLFSGLGSEEIFAGYERHKKANLNSTHKEMFKGLKSMWKRDLRRDYLIAKSEKVNVLTPFLDKEFVRTAMKIHPRLKINKKQNKIIIREIAASLRLKEEFCQRRKKAAQYGSYFDKAIKKLAKRNGFRYKKEYLAALI